MNNKKWPGTPLPDETNIREGLARAVQGYEEEHLHRSISTDQLKTVQFKEGSPRKRPMSAPNLKSANKLMQSSLANRERVQDDHSDVVSDDGSKDTLSNASD